MSGSPEQIPPIRQDVEFIPQYYRGELCYVMNDPVTGEYYRLREPEFVALKCFQRGLGVEETRREIHRLTGAEVDEAEVYKFASQLQSSDLLKSKGMADVRRLARNAEQKRKRRLRSLLSNYLFITIPVWDPDRALDRILPFFRFMLHPLFVGLWMLASAAGLWIILTNARQLIANAFSLLSGWNLLILSIVIFATKFVHEMGHALTCKHLGGRVRAIGPAFLVFQPCMFTDATDAWSFPSKWDRIKVTGAGVLTELALASVAAFVWISSEPGLLKQVTYTVMVTCTVSTILFNANPLLRFDGYYMLSDLLEVPNLRIVSEQYVGRLFDHYVLGLHSPSPEPAPGDKLTFLLFGVARFLYRWAIIVAIGMFLLSIFVPLGILMLATSLYGMVLAPVWRRGERLRRQFQAGKVRLRVVLALAVIFLIIGGLCVVPVDHTVRAPCVVEPSGVTIVRTPAEGRVTAILVREGQLVRQGQKLAQIASPKLVIRAKQLRAQIDGAHARIRAALASNPADYELERAGERKLLAELQMVEHKIERFSLSAPHDGVVVNVRRSEIAAARYQLALVPFPPADADIDMSRFMGMHLEEGTGLMAVAAPDQMVLRAFVHERDVSSLQQGHEMTFKFRSSPGRTYSAAVRSLKPVDVKTIENVGITLADVGYIPVKPGPGGEQEPLVTLYVVEADRLPQDAAALAWGLTGKVIIVHGRGPVGPYYVKKIVRAIRLRLQRI